MREASWPQTLYRLGQAIGALAASAIALLTVTDVTMRYFFNNAIFGAAEITNALLAVLVGAGLIVVAGLRIHISVDLFDAPLRKRFPSGYPRWIFVCEALGTAALAALLVRHAWYTINFGELTAVLEFPIGWVYALVAVQVSAALAVLLSGWRAPAEHERDSV
ncbi:MAG: TRAP transporter small permease subunit [Rhodocyclaceae bacterium]|nr:MAG: TRAP transporter small permease subunit [Rhodocyclaceae bacterium]